MIGLLVAAWRGIGCRARWRLLWLSNAKFIIGVSGIVLNERNEVLLLRHSASKRAIWRR